MKKILIRLFYDKSQRLFRKFFTTKQTIGRERRLKTHPLVLHLGAYQHLTEVDSRCLSRLS